MQVAEVKTSSSASPKVQAKRQPFFSKDGEGSFFSKSNEATSSFFSPATIQPKLTIGQPNDKYEVEADAMADTVVQKLSSDGAAGDSVINSSQEAVNPIAKHVSLVQPKCETCAKEDEVQKKEEEVVEETPDVQEKSIFESEAELPQAEVQTKLINDILPTEVSKIPNVGDVAPTSAVVQSKCEECEQEEAEEVNEDQEPQRKELAGAIGNPLDEEETIQAKSAGSPTEASPDLQSRLNASKGSGSPLSSETSSTMGSTFGTDFSNVRIHTGTQAVQMSQDIGAQAFTHGNDIYFNQGKYDTNSSSGKHLLAHELTHTIQQGGSTTIAQNKIQRWPDWADSAASWVADTASSAASGVADGAAWVGGQVADGAEWVGDQVSSGVEWVDDQISAAANWVMEQLNGAIDSGTDFLNDKWESIEAFGTSSFDDIKNGFSNLASFITSPMSTMVTSLADMNADLLEGAWNVLKAGGDALLAGINSIVNGVLGAGEAIWATVSGFIDGIFETIDGLFDNAAFNLLPDSLKSGIRSAFDGLRSLWNRVSSFWTDLWERLISFARDIISAVQTFIENVITYGISKVVSMVRGLKEVYDYVNEFFADPEGTIAPFVEGIAAMINEQGPGKSQELGNQYTNENYPGGGAQTAENGAVQREVLDGEERTTASLTEVLQGVVYYLMDAWDKMDILGMLWQTFKDMFWPPATIQAIYQQFSTLWNDEWTTAYNSLYIPRNLLVDPLGCLHDIWSNYLILLDFPLALTRTIINVIGLLMGYVTIIVVLVEAVAGAIAGSAAGGVGAIPGFFIGAKAGLVTMAPVGIALAASIVGFEGQAVALVLLRLFTANQVCEKRQMDIMTTVASFVTMAVVAIVALVLALLQKFISMIAEFLKGAPKGIPTPAPIPKPAPGLPAPQPGQPIPKPGQPVPAPRPRPVPQGPQTPAPAQPVPQGPQVPVPQGPQPTAPVVPLFPNGPQPAPAVLIDIAAKFEDDEDGTTMAQMMSEEYEEASIIQKARIDNINPDECKDEKCPAPNVSAPGLGNEAIHGRQPPRNRTGPRIHHTQSEHIIPFATARSLRLAVGLTERARRVLARFDNGMITIMIYRGAAEGKNTQDNVYSARFEADMHRAEVPRKTEQAKQRYEGGDISGGEALAREVVSSVTSALDTLRESAVERTNQEIQIEWISLEEGCTKTNGQRRGEDNPVPEGHSVAGVADRQLDGIIDLVAEALLQQ